MLPESNVHGKFKQNTIANKMHKIGIHVRENSKNSYRPRK